MDMQLQKIKELYPFDWAQRMEKQYRGEYLNKLKDLAETSGTLQEILEANRISLLNYRNKLENLKFYSNGK